MASQRAATGDQAANEQTPLLPSRDGASEDFDYQQTQERSCVMEAGTSQQSSKRNIRRWPSLVALLVLCIGVIIILIAAFLGPQVMTAYAQEAVIFEPTSLSLESFTATGAVARCQGRFTMDSRRVASEHVRRIGKFGTYIARMVETSRTVVSMTLPEYGNSVVGTAELPPVTLNVRDGHTTAIDILTNINPACIDVVRRIVRDWMEGKLGQLRIQGKADVLVRSGLISLPQQTLFQEIVFEGGDVPDIPELEILKLNVREDELPDGKKGLRVDVAMSIANSFPVDFEVPSLGFNVFVPGCAPTEPYIMMANAETSATHVKPKANVSLHVAGLIRQIPKEAITACPGSVASPLDALLANYLHGTESTLYVRGSSSTSDHTPKWLSKLISEITVPVPFQGRTFGHLIKDFKTSKVHFDLPDFFAQPNTPESKPKVSANLRALVSLPDEINFDVAANRMRAEAFVYYKQKKFGNLDMHDWRPATSRPVPTARNHSDLEIKAEIHKAPLTITDNDVFSSVMSTLLSGSAGVNLTVRAKVDVEMETALGKLVVRQIPAEGLVPVSAIGGHFTDTDSLAIKLGELRIAETSPSSLALQAAVSFRNPTSYTAHIPYFDAHIAVNGTLVGRLTLENVSVISKSNTAVPVRVLWAPQYMAGAEGEARGRELISQYISGYNVSLTFKPHRLSVPSQPMLGEALKHSEVNVRLPGIGEPSKSPGGDGGDGKPHFIQKTTMHLLSSTAEFDLRSPLTKTAMFLTHINATAKYHGDVVGTILYEGSILIPPGLSTTPRLPVAWSLGSVGYDAVRNALGGTLKLNAEADISVRIGKFEEQLWFRGRSIGAKVRL